MRICFQRGATKDAINTPAAEPIKYTESRVFKEWKSKYNWDPKPKEGKLGDYGEIFWYTTWAIGFGIMIWACFIAEPDDVNKPWVKPIWELDPKLERPMLEKFLIDRAKAGLPVQNIRQRLKELEAEGR